ncbi:hypothetical protein SAMN05444394_0473 [Algoriphagus halophilus]|uniref:Uncharacterized protein n=1 Tax=Algoriphagus halophilus TaxID=226505 RepID=A0A1N6D8B4_9BACT|nr:hypothetical protein SAMN05444394_0473 [Algoriphagus halophilus]
MTSTKSKISKAPVAYIKLKNTYIYLTFRSFQKAYPAYRLLVFDFLSEILSQKKVETTKDFTLYHTIGLKIH